MREQHAARQAARNQCACTSCLESTGAFVDVRRPSSLVRARAGQRPPVRAAHADESWEPRATWCTVACVVVARTLHESVMTPTSHVRARPPPRSTAGPARAAHPELLLARAS